MRVTVVVWAACLLLSQSVALAQKNPRGQFTVQAWRAPGKIKKVRTPKKASPLYKENGWRDRVIQDRFVEIEVMVPAAEGPVHTIGKIALVQIPAGQEKRF